MFGSAAALTNGHAPEYDHTQWSNLYLLLLIPAAILIVTAPFIESQTESLGMSLLGLFIGAMAYSFLCLNQARALWRLSFDEQAAHAQLLPQIQLPLEPSQGVRRNASGGRNTLNQRKRLKYKTPA